MGNSLCSCNNKQEGKTEVHLNDKEGHKITFKDDETTRDMDNSENTEVGKSKAGVKSNNFNPSNLSPELQNPDLSTLTKIIKLQRNLRKFKNNVQLKRAEFKSPGSDLNSASTPELENKKTPFGNNTNFEYFGERTNGEKEGFGIQKWKDGAIYIGQFQANRAFGLGVFKHSDGDEYKGEFVNDRACGYGEYKHSNGAMYEGYWLGDAQDVIGEEKWSDGSQYVGNYVRGKKQGIGINCKS